MNEAIDNDFVMLRRLQMKIQELENRVEVGDLNNGGGGGTFGGMEARVARLESDMEHVKKSVADIATDMKAVRSTLGDLKVDFGRFDERSKQMPTKGFIFTTSAGLLGACGGLTALIIKFLG